MYIEPLKQELSLSSPPPPPSLQVGDSFVLNCLAEGEYTATLKHFLKRFTAGQDRFEGVDWHPSPGGYPVLGNAISWMECKVGGCW